jgi:hypothetical protein
MTSLLEDKIVSWEVISKYILYINNNILKNKYKVLIFYDSFLLSTISLYMELFKEVYMIKSMYNEEIKKLINPDYVFEFRIERFLM